MIRRGEIYYVNFGPARGSEQAGQRPALVIQNDIGNEFASTTIIAAMTSRRRDPYPFHVHVSARESGLPEASTVMLEQILTISMERLRRRAGQLGPDRMREVDLALHHSLGLSG
ncbi:MAG TPA: type II toxin-antitoxin system PemK/MazF family toxin [Dehalococcoidia bacterium]|nr:type II toxin-antitoxin system PemK/MazF family toxin [Dehalococcoidia bacterium]